MFIEGDRVFDIVNGWGKIIYTYNVYDRIFSNNKSYLFKL